MRSGIAIFVLALAYGAQVSAQEKAPVRERAESTREGRPDPARERAILHLALTTLFQEVQLLDADQVRKLTADETYDVVASFDGPVWSVVLKEPLHLLRIQSADAKSRGKWYLCCEEAGEYGARKVDVTGRALPPWNEQQRLTAVIFPDKTRLLLGVAADMTYHPKGLPDVTTRGGSFQFYVLNPPPNAEEHAYRRLNAGQEPTPQALTASGKRYIRATLQTTDERAPSAPNKSPEPAQAPARSAIPQPPKSLGTPAWFEQISRLWRRWAGASRGA